MEIHAYREAYLSKAQSTLAEACDYAVSDCHMDGSEFVKLFAGSRVCKRMENGEPGYILGKSGIEIAREVIYEITGKMPDAEPGVRFDRSIDYWIGWAVAYYQWYSGRKYSDIFAAAGYDELTEMYYPLHEADVTKFADVMDARMRALYTETALKRMRTLCGLSQAELARESGVRLRSIQMYEQRNKDINKAETITVYRLAKTLGCCVEDLVEYGA